MPQALIGIAAIIGLAWLTSSNRRTFPLKLVVAGLLLQLLLALAFLKLPPLQDALLLINRAVLAVEAATSQGTALVFGFPGRRSRPLRGQRAAAQFRAGLSLAAHGGGVCRTQRTAVALAGDTV